MLSYNALQSFLYATAHLTVMHCWPHGCLQIKKLGEHTAIVNSCCPLRRGQKIFVTGSDDSTVRVGAERRGFWAPRDGNRGRTLHMRGCRASCLRCCLITGLRVLPSYANISWTRCTGVRVGGRPNVLAAPSRLPRSCGTCASSAACRCCATRCRCAPWRSRTRGTRCTAAAWTTPSRWGGAGGGEED